MCADQTTLLSVASLAVSVVALGVALAVFLIERVRREVTPNWEAIRNAGGSPDEDGMTYDNIRDRGKIYAVGEGTMEGPVLDVLHGTLVDGEFPRSFSFRDGEVEYRILPSRASVDAGHEPVVALYWWGPGLFKRKQYGMRLFTHSLRYERHARRILWPFKYVWKPAGIPGPDLAFKTAGRPASERAWAWHKRKHWN